MNERRTLLSDCDDIDINIDTLIFRNDDYSYDVNSKMAAMTKVWNVFKWQKKTLFFINYFRFCQ
jgi:hypothetical protein